MDQNQTIPSQPQTKQLLRPSIMIDDYRDIDAMNQAFSQLVKGRPGWYENTEEEQWYFDPERINEPATDQKTNFSEADLVFPEDVSQMDAYLAPVITETQSILGNQSDWHYDDRQQGWIYTNPNVKHRFLRKIDPTLIFFIILLIIGVIAGLF